MTRTSPFRIEEGWLLIFLRTSPGASRNDIGGLWRGPADDIRLSVRVTAAPDKGKANRAVIEVLAGALGVSKSAVSIVAGDKDRLKTVAISADSADIIERLEAIIRRGEEAGA